MKFILKHLESVARLQKKYSLPMLIGIILITLIMLSGLANLTIDTDISASMPDDLPVYITNDKITDKFGSQDVIILLLSLDSDLNYQDAPKDIRTKDIIDYLYSLETALKKESSIEDAVSLGGFLHDVPIDSLKNTIEGSEQLRGFVSDDYSDTLIYIITDASSEKKVNSATKLVQEKIEGLSIPSGTKITISGNPPIRIRISEFLKSDAVFTISLASSLILLLLILVKKSFTKGVLIFTPLALGLVWTLGSMGWVNLPLSTGTVGIGAMILGLGVEYGVFMHTRYDEERHNGKTQSQALKIAVPSVGNALSGSGLTTMAGFLALTLSTMPLLQDLGLTLALGIMSCLIATIIAMPVIIIYEEKLEYFITYRNHQKITRKKENLRSGLE